MAMLPYKFGFLFIDEFLEVDENHIVARRRFRGDEFFYTDHFCDRPITPGVILLEAMCQCGMVAQGLYLLASEIGTEHASRHRFLVTNSQAEWFEPVRPGSQVIMRGQLTSWRKRRIRTHVKMFSETDVLVAEASISGMGLLWSSEALSCEARGESSGGQEQISDEKPVKENQ
jgi:3-hydroxyacyl-[acyl-carrier-protein] dehydratase